MVKNKKYIIISFLILFLLPNIAYSIESAAHKVEVAKCFGIIMTIKNNSKYENNIIKATNKIILLAINSSKLLLFIYFGCEQKTSRIISINFNVLRSLTL